MKVLVNGGVNLSELDGWWARHTRPKRGGRWATAEEHGDNPAWDAVEADALYELLEREVVPDFCANTSGSTISRLRPPTASELRTTAQSARTLFAGSTHYWRHALRKTWATLRFGEVKVETRGAQHAFEVGLFLGDLDPDAVRVELLADAVTCRPAVRQEMVRTRQSEVEPDRHVYSAAVSAAPPQLDYTARVMRHWDGVAVPLEVGPVLWQR